MKSNRLKRTAFLLVAGMAMCHTAMAADEVTVTVDDVTIGQGSTAVMTIRFETEMTNLSAVQAYFIYPEGIPVLEDENGNPTFTVGDCYSDQSVQSRFYMKDKSDRKVSMTAFSFNSSAFATTSGSLISYTLSCDESTPVGTYTGTLVDVVFSTQGGEGIELPEITFNINVVDPKDAYTVLDETSTTAPVAAENANVIVKRTIKAGNWSTLCLPFAMTGEQLTAVFGDDVQIADMTSVEDTSSESAQERDEVDDITVTFETIDISNGLEANHPCIIKTKKDISEFEVEGVTLEPEEQPTLQVGKKKADRSYMYGTYVAATEVPEEGLFLSDNKFWYSTGKTKMKGFRAYFMLNNTLDSYYDETSDARVNFIVDGTTTSIVDLGAEQVSSVYDIQGRKLESVPQQKGVYIINGQKQAKR